MNKIDKDTFRRLSKRSDMLGITHISLHLSILFLSLFMFHYFFISQFYLLSIISFLSYGFVVSFLGWTGAAHEMAHRSAFASQKINEFFLNVCCFLTWSNKVYFRKTHMAHHKNTFVQDIDYEVEWDIKKSINPNISLVLFDILKCYRTLKAFILNSVNIVPANKLSNLELDNDMIFRLSLFKFSRGIVIAHLSVLSILLLLNVPHIALVILFGPFAFTYPSRLLAFAQHHGMEPVPKITTENSRTVILNRILSFLYWNMNYHVEHHLYPNVPFYRLPELRSKLFGYYDEKRMSLINVFELLKSDQKKVLRKVKI